MQKKPRPDDALPVDYPSDHEISERAFDMFFEQRDVPGAFGDCWRRAEAELLERAYHTVLRRTPNRRFRPRR